MLFFKIAALLSPLISALLAGWITYNIAIKAKKMDFLYQNKIAAFKEISGKLIGFKKFCLGRNAFYLGNEFSPYYERNVGAMSHRMEIGNVFDQNSIFFSKESREAIEKLIGDLSVLCNAEISVLKNQDLPGIEKAYVEFANKADDCIEILYTDLNLKNT